VDRHQRDLAFETEDYVYLKVSPSRGTKRFGVKGKLAPRYVGPFPVVEWIGEVAHKLTLLPKLAGVHDVFHVSQLKKCFRVPEEQLLLDDLEVQEDLTYAERPINILESTKRVTRGRRICMCKVQWNHHTENEATWEREEEMKSAYCNLFASQPKSRGRDTS
jgi:hypothetical protein